MSQKRLPEEEVTAGPSSDGGSSPDEKRQKIRSFQGVVKEALQMHKIKMWLVAIEPLMRKIIREEVETAISKHLTNVTRECEKQVGSSTTRCLQLEFKKRLSLPIFTGSRIEAEDSSTMSVALVDALTGQVVSTGPESSLKVDIVVLDGNFEVGEEGCWTADEFRNYIVKERCGKRSLLIGDVCVDLNEGIGVVGELSFTDNSSWTRSRRFRLGARIADGHFNGIRIREAKTDPFTVKDHRGELYKKHYPPSLDDDVWRLEKIGKDGAFHRRLSSANINTVKDFLHLLRRDSASLRNILGSGMSARMWDVTVDHARTCISNEVHVYYPDNQRKTGVVFSTLGEALGILSEQQFIAVNGLTNNERAEAHALVKQAYENWSDVITCKKDDVFGRSSPMSPISLFGSENLYSNVSSPVKNDGVVLSQSSILSPDVFSMGAIKDFDPYAWDTQSTLLYDDCSSQALFHGLISDPPADLSVSVGSFESQSVRTHSKRRRGWKTLSYVFWFIRRVAIQVRQRVHETS